MKPAEADCYFCAGSGVVPAAKAQATGRILRPNQRCLCTVSDDEVDAALPDVIDDILKRISPND